MTRILILPGSARQGSLNLRLARTAAACLLAAGAQPHVLDLRALDLPVYDGDLETSGGVPAGAATLVEQFAAHEAVIVVSPEYNAFPSPLLINAIDWATRLPAHKAAMNGKPALLASASPGPLGGLRSLLVLRNFLSINPGLLVLPQQFALGQAAQAFAPDGSLADPKQQASFEAALQALLQMAQRLRA
jgi:chromate reductase